MRYYSVLGNGINESLEKYIVKHNETNDVFLLSFDDSDLDYIIENAERLIFIDEHRKHHLLEDKKVTPGGKFSWSYNKWYKKFCRIYADKNREEGIIQGWLKDTDETRIVNQGKDIGSFKSYRFIDKENETAFPFRFKRSKGETPQPIVIYFCGAGSVGIDNFKPFTETIPRLFQLVGHTYNFLIPQPKTSVNYAKTVEEENAQIDTYTSSVKKLVELLAENGSIDKNRIYVFGNSLGGCLTWRFAYHFPDFCACAMPVIGAFDLVIEGSRYGEFERLVNLPIWVAHSSDDKIVNIDRDDHAVARLKELGGNVKYTRWDKYGHAMAGKFYFREKWADWMFAQNKNNNNK